MAMAVNIIIRVKIWSPGKACMQRVAYYSILACVSSSVLGMMELLYEHTHINCTRVLLQVKVSMGSTVQCGQKMALVDLLTAMIIAARRRY